MNLTEAPTDNAEVLKLFRERDMIGADTNLFLRAIRHLTKDGKPIGQISVITVPIDKDKNMPIGMLTLQKRLVFWPVLPRRTSILVDKPNMPMPDHITVEFPSEKVHVTSYDSVGKSNHHSDAWRSGSFQESELRLLYTFLVRINIIADQDVLVSRKFLTPKADENRRTTEFARLANNFKVHHLPLPGNASDKDYVYFGMFLAPKLMTSAESLPKSLMPKLSIDDMIDGWPENEEFPIIVGQFKVGEQLLCMAAGFPPGRLKEDLCFGFPRRVPIAETMKSGSEV